MTFETTGREAPSADNGMVLPLMESFYTLQGEGHHTGKAAHFLRIGGCDVGCHWCDVKESWNAALHPATPVEDILQTIHPKARTVVITGGEPLTWDMGPLTQALRSAGYAIHLETSGAYPHTGQFDWVCLSPKKTKATLPDWYALADELKVIVYNQHDLTWAAQHAEHMAKKDHLYLQPEWSRRQEVIPSITAFIMEHPHWKVSLQTHKYLGIP
jgi:organic radical activating enzyme